MRNDGESSPGGKVDRLITEYDLDGIGQTLEAKWLAEEGDRHSLRDLADWFNQTLLERALERAGATPIEGEVGNLYRILREEDVSPGMRTTARRQLERDGVDVAQLERDFVTHQTVHTYLREHRGAELPDEQDRPQKEGRTIRKLQGRATAVTEDALERLRDGDEIELGDFEVFTRIQVLCADCGSQYEAVDLLERGGCDCDTRADS